MPKIVFQPHLGPLGGRSTKFPSKKGCRAREIRARPNPSALERNLGRIFSERRRVCLQKSKSIALPAAARAPGRNLSGSLSVIVISSPTAPWVSLAPMGLGPVLAQTHRGQAQELRSDLAPRRFAARRGSAPPSAPVLFPSFHHFHPKRAERS